MNTQFTLPLDATNATLELVGGKGESLTRMITAKLPVPGGFHVTTDAYRAFVAENNLQAHIFETLQNLDLSNPTLLENASQSIISAFLKARMPVEVINDVTQAYKVLEDSSKAVAVRSSATAEDLPEASFAGQQDSFLNVIGEEHLLEAIRKCWASLWTARAISYRDHQRIPAEDVALAVVVQAMVPAEAAGILFTANPLNGQRHQALINASWGLGEAIVGGQVTPDTLTVDKSTGKVIKREIGAKSVKTVMVAGGTRNEPVPAGYRNTSVLTDDQLASLMQLGNQIEMLYKMPMDIEWAFADGKFSILQARPITTLPTPETPIPSEWKLPKGAYAAMRNNIVELMTDPLTPLFSTLGLECVNSAMNDWMEEFLGKRGIIPDEMIITVNHYAYYNGSVKFIPAMGLIFDSVGIMKRMFTKAVERWTEEGRVHYIATVDSWKSQDWRQLSATQLIDAVRQLSKAAINAYGALVSGVIPAAWMSEGLFTAVYKLLKRRNDPIASTYLLGFDNIPLQAEKQLFEIAQWAKGHPELAQHLLEIPLQELLKEIENGGVPSGVAGQDWNEWQALIREYLQAYGHMIYNLDFGNPVPADSPGAVLDSIRFFIGDPAADPQKRQQESKNKREEAAREMLSRLKGLRKKLFQKNLERAQRYAPLREDGLADVGLGYPLLREMLNEIGNRLEGVGVIAHPEDIFYLQKDELIHAAALLDNHQTPENFTEKIILRKAQLQAAKLAEPPKMLPNLKKFGSAKKKTGSVKGSTIKGVPASPGEVTAPACVVLGPEDFDKMKTGDVLVAPLTTPAWTPLFTRASAVVTDVGGPLSHGSIVAREFGIPAVLGTGVATRRIQNGQLITVNGSTGTVGIK